ncbi:MAG: hypothetical protein NFCOHLIN_01097 [Gammaproteobacteria bacterium]|nr:hypothetical protein [Gammaproteobacteria bacterium]
MPKSDTWFRPGQSGNPRGRPKVNKTLRDLARSCTEDALKALVEVMNDRRAAPLARVVAATAILDRGWGKPESSLTLNPGEQPVQRVHIDLVGGYAPKAPTDTNGGELRQLPPA